VVKRSVLTEINEDVMLCYVMVTESVGRSCWYGVHEQR